jgi:multidrug efflux pump subunit AcrA (membrane-fusion protein)
MKNTVGKKVWVNKRLLYGVIAFVILAGGGAFGYYKLIYKPPAEATTSALQTTSVKRGDLVLYASGTGTLVAKQSASLGFQTSGQVATVTVNEGDRVEAGQVLATLDDSSIQISYAQAKRALAELTSDAAIATAEEAVANSTTEVKDALNTLIYLISPTVYRYETNLEKAQAALVEAQAASDANPSEENTAKLQDAEKAETNAQKSVKAGWDWWAKTYVPEMFTSVQRTRSGTTKTTSKPNDAEIASTRAAYTLAKATLQENEYYLAALKGEEIPSDATGSSLTTLEEAKEALKTAEKSLQYATITSPITGMVTSVTIAVGDSVGTDAVITIADNTTPMIEFYLDEEDWDNVAPGYNVEVIFDSLPEKTYTGKVVEVSPALVSENGSTLVKGTAELDNVSQLVKENLMLGLNASIDVIGGRADAATLVSVDALHEVSSGVYGVFVQKNNVLTFTKVDIGIMDTINAEVKSGLNPGDVVSTGLLETN